MKRQSNEQFLPQSTDLKHLNSKGKEEFGVLCPQSLLNVFREQLHLQVEVSQ